MPTLQQQHPPGRTANSSGKLAAGRVEKMTKRCSEVSKSAVKIMFGGSSSTNNNNNNNNNSSSSSQKYHRLLGNRHPSTSSQCDCNGGQPDLAVSQQGHHHHHHHQQQPECSHVVVECGRASDLITTSISDGHRSVIEASQLQEPVSHRSKHWSKLVRCQTINCGRVAGDVMQTCLRMLPGARTSKLADHQFGHIFVQSLISSLTTTTKIREGTLHLKPGTGPLLQENDHQPAIDNETDNHDDDNNENKMAEALVKSVFALQPQLSGDDVVTPSSAITQTNEDHPKFSNFDQMFDDLKNLLHQNGLIQLSVFLNYLLTNTSHANILFFHLFSEDFKKKKGDRGDLQKWAYEIHSSFTLNDGSPLFIGIADTDQHAISMILRSSELTKVDESSLRHVFDNIREVVKPELEFHLAEFRHHRELGLTTMYGDVAKAVLMDRLSQVAFVESMLVPFIEKNNLANAMNYADTAEQTNAETAMERDLIATCIATFLRRWDIKKLNNLDISNIDVFFRKDKYFFHKGQQLAKKFSLREKQHVVGHQLTERSFIKPTRCSLCERYLYGVGPQGYICVGCGFTFDETCIQETDLLEKKLVCSRPSRKHTRTLVARSLAKAYNQSPGDTFAASADQQGRCSIPNAEDEFIRNGDLSNVQRSKSDRWPRYPLSRQSIAVASQCGNRSSSNPIITYTVYSHIPSPPGGHRGPSEQVRKSQSMKSDSSTSTVTRPTQSSSSTSFYRNHGEDRHSMCHPHQLPTGFKNLDEHMLLNGAFTTSNLMMIDPDFIESLVDEPCPIDSDMEVDSNNLPALETFVNPEKLKGFDEKQLQRHSSVLELYHTERTHLKTLKILKYIYKDRLQKLSCISDDDIKSIFGNLENLIALHDGIKKSLHNAIKHEDQQFFVGNALLRHFTGDNGMLLANECFRFLENQKQSIALIRQKEQVPEFGSFLRASESKPLCRKLSLRDFLPCVMTRLARYTLLFEQIRKHTDDNEEKDKLTACVKAASSVNHRVNEGVRKKELNELMAQIRRNLFINMPASPDIPEDVQNGEFDFDARHLVYNSVLKFQWPLRNLEFEACLFTDALVLFQRIPIAATNNGNSSIGMQSLLSDSHHQQHHHQQQPSSSSPLSGAGSGLDASFRYVLQNHRIKRENSEMDVIVCPYIPIDQFMIKKKAGPDTKAFFLVSKGKSRQFLVELRAASKDDCERWFTYVDQCQNTKCRLLPNLSGSSEDSGIDTSSISTQLEPILEPSRSNSVDTASLVNTECDLKNVSGSLKDHVASSNGEDILPAEFDRKDYLTSMIDIINTHNQMKETMKLIRDMEKNDKKFQNHCAHMENQISMLGNSIDNLMTYGEDLESCEKHPHARHHRTQSVYSTRILASIPEKKVPSTSSLSSLAIHGTAPTMPSSGEECCCCCCCCDANHIAADIASRPTAMTTSSVQTCLQLIQATDAVASDDALRHEIDSSQHITSEGQ